MKFKTLSLLALIFVCISIATAIPFTDIPNKEMISLTVGGCGLLFTSMMTATWLSFIAGLVRITGKSLSQKTTAGALSFKNLSILERNHDFIKRKLDLSVDYISKLSQLDQHVQMDVSLKKDKIGQALLSIREEMVKLKEEEDKRKWITEGLARFSEILRNKSELSEYTDQILTNLVIYMGAHQGALFIVYDDDNEGRFLQMIAGYACDANAPKKIFEGEGLLGQCLIDKKFNIVTHVPENFLKVNSGLGQGVPQAIIIAPLIFNEQLYGVIEIAQFETFKQHKIEFLSRVGDNIAAEIATIKSHEQTQKLLKESNSLTEELQRHEAEMQRNLDELAIAQNEMMRRQTELAEVMKAIDNTLATVEFNLAGTLMTANEIFLKVLGFTLGEVKGKSFLELTKDDQTSNLMWDNIRLGKSFSGEFRMKNHAGKDLWLTGTLNPINIAGGGPEKVMLFAQFTSQEKEKINDLNVIVNALRFTLPVVEFNENFTCKSANEKFLKMFGVSRMELRNKSLKNFIDPKYDHVFASLRQEIVSKDFMSLMLPLIMDGKSVMYESSITAARDHEGNIIRVILLLVKEVEEKVETLDRIA